jgi:acetolactate synthase-1/2/3 large subunit
MKIKISDLIANFLSKNKINTVPVYQGGAVMNLIDSIGVNKKIKYFVPYHEQALSMQVDTMARLDGFAAGFATSGPGATNLLTGVCSAFYDSIPCFFFTGQVGQIHLKKERGVRQLGFQESDIVEIFKPITKYCKQINNALEVNYELEKGLFLAKSGRPGPVLFDIPFNIQKTIVDTNKLKKFSTKRKKNKAPKNKILKIFDLILKSKKPLILVGGGIKRSEQENNFIKFVEKYNLPFVTTWMSQDLCSYQHHLYNGSIGKNGHNSANILASKCDLLICLGQRFAVKNILKNFGSNAKTIAIDIDKNEIENGLIKPNVGIKCLLQDFFKVINTCKVNLINTNKAWLNECRLIKENYFKLKIKKLKKENFINAYDFFYQISDLIPKNSILFPDAGANQCWFFQSYLQKKGQIIINHSGHSPMGHSICAAIGGFYSKNSKNKKLIAFIGDGGFMMNVQELEYIKNKKIPIKIVVLDNRCLGNTKLGTSIAFKGRTHGNDKKHGYYPPDIKNIAKGFGFQYFEYLNAGNKVLKIKFSKFLLSKKPSIFRLHLSDNQNVIEFNHLLEDNKSPKYSI